MREITNTLHSRRTNVRWIICSLLVVGVIVIGYVLFSESRNGILTVAFLDVGQGDAIYIEAPNGNQILIDAGPGPAVLRALGRVIPFYDRSLDIVIATHPDQDHVGGLPLVMERFRVHGVMTTETVADTGAYRAFMESVERASAHHVIARTGTRIILDEDVVLEILFPDRDTTGWDTNTSSIVAKLTYGDVSFLLTGDAPASIEQYLLGTTGRNLQSTVLKLGHHGSKTSSSREFVSIVDPRYAIVSAGKKNSYGHPSPEVVSLMQEFNIPILSIGEWGSILFTSNGQTLTIR